MLALSRILLKPQAILLTGVAAAFMAASGTGVLMLSGAAMIYGLIALAIAISLLANQIAGRFLFEGTLIYLLLACLVSVFFGPAAVLGWQKTTSSKSDTDIRAANAEAATTLCPDYFRRTGFWDHHVRLRDRSWCSAFPEYDAAAASVSTEATGSTDKSPNGLWK